jgi:acyl phosphate:glycerol-3-phosphate acyltransferase
LEHTQMAMLAGAYLLGSIPFGLLICRALTGRDPLQNGSGNIGATNVGRLAGKPAGLLVLLLDAGKGAGPAALAIWLLDGPWETSAVCLSAFLGSVCSVYLGFRGGKGVATAMGIFLIVAPLALAGILITLAGALWLSGHMSVGSMAGWASAPFWTWLADYPMPIVTLSIMLFLTIIWKHRENLSRLRTGEEHGWK